MQQPKHNTRGEKGQTMVEFALILPILLVLMLGIAQFGITFNNYVTLTDAVRAGARKAAVSRNTSNPAGACEAAVLPPARTSTRPSSTSDLSCVSSWARLGRHRSRELSLRHQMLDWTFSAAASTPR